MPTYEYACDDCKHQFEEFQSITAEPTKECPKCRGAVRRLISAGNGLIFKGSGFYITDYKQTKKSSDSAEKSGSKPATESGKSSESGKSDKSSKSSKPDSSSA